MELQENFCRLEELGWFLPGRASRSFPLVTTRDGGYTKAAVLFLISHYDGELHVLLTKRSHSVRIHKGVFNCILLSVMFHEQAAVVCVS